MLIRISELNHLKITLPHSGITLTLGTIVRRNYDNLMKKNELKTIYVKSTPEEFSKRYIDLIRISDYEVDVTKLQLKDIIFLLNCCLRQDGKDFQITKVENVWEALSLFRDKIIGVKYADFASYRDIWKQKLVKIYDNYLGRIKSLLGSNSAEEGKINSSGHHEEYKQARLYRLKQNIKQLRVKENSIKYANENPDQDILEILRQPEYNREEYLLQFNRFLNFSLRELDSKYLDFPYRWCGFLPSDEFNRLYHEWKKGVNVEQLLIETFKHEDTIDYLYGSLRNSLIGVKRKNLIFEAISSFYGNNCSVAILILLPQIEGLLWDLAELLNNQGQFIFEPGTGYDNSAFKANLYEVDKTQESYILKDGTKKKYLLINRKDAGNLSAKLNKSGKPVKSDTIGTLLKESAFRFYLDIDFIGHFCAELYLKRNEILHGRNLAFGSIENAIKKLMVLFMILYYFQDVKEHQQKF